MSANKETAAVRLELEGQTLTSIENYRARFKKMPSRAAAVRQLLEQALTEHSGPSAAASAA